MYKMKKDNDFQSFIKQHESQLLLSDVPKYFWQSLHAKLNQEIFDANNVFYLLSIEYDYEDSAKPPWPLWALQVNCDGGIKYKEEQHIYLVDHACTFRCVSDARNYLLNEKVLLDRMCNVMGVDQKLSTNVQIDKICKLMWKYCNTYTIGNASSVENRMPIWYIMDELGCAIHHSDDPNFRAVPFIYMPQGITYTLIYPVRDLDNGELVTRNYIEGTSGEIRDALMLPWKSHSFLNINCSQEEPDVEYFLKGHEEESLPQLPLVNLKHSNNVANTKIPKLQVYTEYELVEKFLNETDYFEITDDENIADVLWYTRHFKDYNSLSIVTPNKFVNQFPFENVLTIKDLLSIVCRRLGSPPWLPITYNLSTELVKFVAVFQKREQEHLDNHWICKPWNLARGLDTHVTNNIDHIVRLASHGPPKIIQKYIEKPVLFQRPECHGAVKFDIRYVLLLKSIRPLHAYIYNNFFIRFANKPFELDNLHEYETHFTVMNYKSQFILKHMQCKEFLKAWHEQYPRHEWTIIEKNILLMLRQLLEAATMEEPPRGIANSPQSRALYAADIMLAWTDDGHIQPQLLEINWTPDCKRACDYYPQFYNNIFSLLFLDQQDTSIFTEI